MTYRGESPSKKLVRLEFWRKVEKLVPGLHGKNVLSLASSEGGDISVLLGMKMNPTLIHSVDTDPHAADAAQWKLGVTVHKTDVYKYAKGKKFGAILLDFCGPLRESMITKVGDITKQLYPKGVIGLGLLAGREQGVLQSAVKGHLVDYEGDSFMARVHLITNALHHHRSSLLLKYAWYYTSHSSNRYGKPMIVLLYQIEKGRQPSPEQQVRKAQMWEFESDKSDLAAEGLKLVKKGLRADQLLNVSKQSIAAWKAHATRGTYRA